MSEPSVLRPLIPLFRQVAAALFLMGAATSLCAAEYFVSKSGSDSNPGTDRAAAFLTVQKGIDAMGAGDTLTIGPGEYLESVFRDGLGEAGKTTLIRAEIHGTVVIRGDVPAPEFKPHAGFQFVYAAPFEQVVQSVNELDTLRVFEPMPNVEELELNPGTYCYDPEKKMLYIATSDMQPPDRHHYTVSVNNHNGIYFERPVGVVLDGLAAAGFNSSREVSDRPGKYTVWGMLLSSARNCVIRNSTAFLNGGGMVIVSGEKTGGGNVIEDCIAYGNTSPFGGSGGNISIFAPNNDKIRRCLAYRSGDMGVRLYSDMFGTSVIEDSLGWGNAYDLFVKGRNDSKFGSVNRSVAVGVGQVKNVSESIIGGANPYLAADLTTKDNILFLTEKLDQNAEFADPLNFDFRLQSDSKFRGSGPDGRDRGPFPYKADVFYVKPGGDDGADGTSMATAWKSLGRAVKDLKGGETLYIEEGTYPGGVAIGATADSGKPVSIRGRGTGRVVIAGTVDLDRANGVAFERVNFLNTVRLQKSRNVHFRNCRFGAETTGLDAVESGPISVAHAEFANFQQTAIGLADCQSVRIESCVFDNVRGPAVTVDGTAGQTILHSDYNSYADPARAWKIDGSVFAFADLQKVSDRYSRILKPEFVPQDGMFILRNPVPFLGGGALGRGLGVQQDIMSDVMRMTKPVVHSVSDTTANIEWLVSRPADCVVAWGETESCENSTKYEVREHGSFSLTGLKPGTTYYFRIKSLTIPWTMTSNARPADVADPEFETITFTTAKAPNEPRTFYVAVDGNNTNTGLSRENAWRTVSHAAARCNAGDTVLIAGGIYPERIRIRATGDQGRPVTFRALPGEKVVFASGEKLLENAWTLNGKNHILIDGFYFDEFRMVGGGLSAMRIFNLYRSNDVMISRCFYDGRSSGYTPGLLTADDCKNLTLSNCVIISGFNGMGLRSCANFRLEHCVFVRTMIQTMTIGSNGLPHLIKKNIFTDSSAFKVTASLFEWSGQDAIRDEENCLFLRVPDEQRKPFWMLNFREGGKELGHVRMSAAEYQSRVRKSGSIVADPQFAILRRMESEVEKLAALNREDGKVRFPVDVFFSAKPPLDFPDLFATNPEVVRRGIGLQPEKFSDFHFQRKAGAGTPVAPAAP